MTAKKSRSAKTAKRRNQASSSGKQRRVIVVLGMHRSGTSALTRVISLLGATLPQRLMPASEANPRGYFESQTIFELHQELLRSAGTNWFDLAPFPPDWLASPVADEWVERLSTGLTGEFGDSALFVLKDPRISRLLPVWSKVFERLDITPSYVIAVRNPLEVAASLHRSEGTNESKTTLLWLQHMLEAEQATRGAARCFVRYDDLLSDWRGVASRIESRFDVSFPRRGRRAEAEVDSFLTSDLRHHNASDDEVFERRDVAKWVKDVFAWARAAASDEETDPELLDLVATAFNVAERVYGPILNSVELSQARAEHRVGLLETEVLDLQAGISKREVEIENLSAALEERAAELAARSEESLAADDWSGVRDGDVDRLIELVKLILSAAIGRLEVDSTATRPPSQTTDPGEHPVASLVDAGMQLMRGARDVGMLREDVARLSAHLTSATEATLALRPSLEATSETSRLIAEVAGLRDEVSRRDARIDELRQAGEDASRRHGALSAEAGELKRALEANRSEIAELTQGLRQRGEELEAARARLVVEEQSRHAMDEDLATSRRESGERAREIERLDDEIADLRKAVKARDAQLETQKEENAENFRAFESERLAMRQEIAGGRAQVDRLQAAIHEFEDRDRERAEDLQQLAVTRREAVDLRIRVAGHEDRMAAARAEARSLKEDLERARTDIEQMEIRARRFHDQKERLVEARDQIEALMLQLEQEQQRAEQHLGAAQRRADEVADLTFCVEQLRSELDSQPLPRRRLSRIFKRG